jgi:hypothetical protein
MYKITKSERPFFESLIMRWNDFNVNLKINQTVRATVNNMILTSGKRKAFGESDVEEKIEIVCLILWKFET